MEFLNFLLIRTYINRTGAYSYVLHGSHFLCSYLYNGFTVIYKIIENRKKYVITECIAFTVGLKFLDVP